MATSLRSLRRPLSLLAGTATIGLLLAWLMGAFHGRLPPGPPIVPSAGSQIAGSPAAGARHTVTPTRRRVHEAAVGTIRAVHETVVASRILGRVTTLAITRAGQPVQKDDLLVELEADDLRAVAEQARAAHRVAATRADKAALDLSRTEQLVQQGAAAIDKRDADRSALAAATAELDRAAQNIAAADSALGFATIRAPITGIVVDKQVQPGDVVQPGQPICTLYDPTQLQLVAVVREELAGRLTIGQPVDVTLEALGKQCRGTVAEIVPTAQANSRSFEVKVTGPCQPGIVTGMFGRLLIPLDEVDELLVPERALRSTGQLEFVEVVENGGANGGGANGAGASGVVRRRFVRVGDRRDGAVQILSGLRAGETILLTNGG